MAIFPLSSALPTRLVALRRGLLVALLAALYLVLWQGPETLLGKTLFVVHLGLFMLWQPFVHAEQRLSVKSLIAVACVVAMATLFLTGWLLSIWIMMLAGIVGGKVLLFGARDSRLFFLLALGFLVMALLLMAAPMALPMVYLPKLFVRIAYVGLPLALIVMVLLPRGREPDPSLEVVDFINSLFVFLLLAVLMLASLAAMLMFGSAYVEALLQALLLMGAVLLLLGWAWNPHAGFSGLGNLFSRYMMSIGLPVEQWLQALADLALREEDPQRFLEDACSEMAQRLPWITGGEWTAGGRAGCFGVTGGRRSEFRQDGMTLALYTRHRLSPTLMWHLNLMARLLAEFHADKRRALALKQLSYMQAIHETGARLTHDVKNLLQSLNTLCSAGIEPGAESSPEYRSLLRRQLPAITDRLAETLAKLGAPQNLSSARWLSVAVWWQELRQRMAALDWVDFKAESPIIGQLPAEVFFGVADNLIRNAADKRLREPALRLQVELLRKDAGFELIVCDNGSAMPKDVASSLFVGPVSSESGYGIGLYHAARYAQAAGYQLELAENRAGRVCFRLALAI
ncbi:MAG: sensor histidine kinase [Sulfuritalea sp.]|nr:sensor histidine kinase [Sulfuritalea sp.]